MSFRDYLARRYLRIENERSRPYFVSASMLLSQYMRILKNIEQILLYVLCATSIFDEISILIL